MKSTLVTIAGIASIAYLVPASFAELCGLISPDKEKAEAIALNAANQYFVQGNLIKVRTKIAEALTKKFPDMVQNLFIGKVQVESIVNGEGVITGYKATEGKKTWKAEDAKPTKEKALAFIERVVKEKALDEKTIHAIVQKVADANGFSAEQKRVRGSVASKPVGVKWTKLATKIIAAGNGEKAAARLSAALDETVDISGEDGTKRLALALSNEAKRALAKLAEEQGSDAGTDEQTLVVDGVKG